MKKILAFVLSLVLTCSLFMGAIPARADSLFGIDVSEHQATINWTQVATQAKFAIIRASVTLSATKEHRADYYFEQNYAGAKAAGVPIGTYFFVRGTTAETIRSEVDAFAEIVKGKQFEYPVFLDLESDDYHSMTKAQVTALVKVGLDYLKSKGFYAGVYSYYWFANTYLDMSQLSGYDLWMAHYASSCGYTGGAYTMWQNSDSGSCAGVGGNVDTNYCLVNNYPEIIKNAGLNGYAPSVSYPYVIDDNSLMLYDGESLRTIENTGWNSDLSVTTGAPNAGNGLRIQSTNAGDVATAYVGAAAFVAFDNSADLTGYDYMAFDLYIPTKMAGDQAFEINCVNRGFDVHDGMDYRVQMGGLEPGWYSFIAPKDHFSKIHGDQVQWSDITGMRIAWFNYNANQKETYFIVDNIRFVKATQTVNTISLNVNGGNNMNGAAISAIEGQTVSLPTPTRDGYTFLGWSPTGYVADIVGSTVTVTGNATYYAQWEEMRYTVTLNANGGSVTPGSVTANSGEQVTLPTPTRDGYTFLGWSPTGYVADIVDNNITVTGNVTYYAQWQQNQQPVEEVKVQLNVNGGNGSDSEMTVTHGQEVTLPTPTREGYTFMGWSTNQDATEGSLTVTVTEDATYYAIWKENVPTPIEPTGDLNGDGTTDAKDALAALKHAVGKDILSAELVTVGDLNKDGTLDAKDALAMLKIAVGK